MANVVLGYYPAAIFAEF